MRLFLSSATNEKWGYSAKRTQKPLSELYECKKDSAMLFCYRIIPFSNNLIWHSSKLILQIVLLCSNVVKDSIHFSL